MTDRPEDGPLIFVIAGEASGDAIAGRVMESLKTQFAGKVRFAGVGGETMEAQGLRSLFPLEQISVMGIAEILPHARRLLRLMRHTADEIDRLQPDILFTVDVPGFCFGVWRRIRRSKAPRVHFVAPSVWAWRPWRVHKFARHLDHLLAFLPFEPPYFERVGLPCTFVGHPVIEGDLADGDGPAFRARHGIDPESPLLCVLPGSRRAEVKRLLGPFGETVRRLAVDVPGLRVVLPTLPHLADGIAAETNDWPVPVTLLRDGTEKIDCFHASDAALAASGSVALELAIARVPMITVYRVTWTTYQIAKRMIRTPYGNLVNILLDRPAVPELYQYDATPEKMSEAVRPLVKREAPHRAQLTAFDEAVEMLSVGDTPPSVRAAEVIADVLGRSAPATSDEKE